MEEQIRTRAYALWEADGRPHGMDQSHWFKAVTEVASAATPAVKPAAKRKTTRSKKAA